MQKDFLEFIGELKEKRLILSSSAASPWHITATRGTPVTLMSGVILPSKTQKSFLQPSNHFLAQRPFQTRKSSLKANT